ncbi:MAG: hypothetical protein WCW02_03600, partial [Candidatus Buchananbacteria bacterium]
MPQLCPELTTKLDSLKQLKQEFDLEIIKAQSLSPSKPEDLVSVREAKIRLEQKLEQISKILWQEFYVNSPRGLTAVEKKINYHEIKTLKGHTKAVFTLQVLPDGQIVSGSEDSTIKIWKPDAKGNYQEPKTLEGHTDWVRTLQIL